MTEKKQAFFPSEEDIQITVNTIFDYCEEYVQVMGYPDDFRLHHSLFDLVDVAVRVLKREEYYLHFHGIDVSEVKRSALICYWLCVIHPFTVIDERYEGQVDTAFFNERLAASILLWSSLDKGLTDEQQLDATDIEQLFNSSLSDGAENFFEKLVYSLRYRNLSLDECVLLSEAITPASF